MNVTITVDSSDFDKMAAKFPAALERAKTQALKDIGAAVASRATLAFRTPAMRPSPWAPRKPTYTVTVNKKTGKKTKKPDNHLLLIKTGALRQSIGWKLEGSNSVVIGTDRKYAGYHQTGTKHMPARPFMPVDADGKLVPQMKRKIDKIISDDYADEIRKARGG